MATLAELIAESQAKYPEAFAKLGNTAFSNLDPDIQVGINQNIQQNASTIRSIFPSGTSGLNDFIKQQSLNITNLFKLGVSTTQRSQEIETLRDNTQAGFDQALKNDNYLLDKITESVQNTTRILGISEKGEAGSPFDFLTNNPIAFGLGAGGLAIGALALILVLRR